MNLMLYAYCYYLCFLVKIQINVCIFHHDCIYELEALIINIFNLMF